MEQILLLSYNFMLVVLYIINESANALPVGEDVLEQELFHSHRNRQYLLKIYPRVLSA